MSQASEFVHVSQFYETLLGLGFLAMFVVELLAICREFHGALATLREKEVTDYENWLQGGGRYAPSDQPPSLEAMDADQKPRRSAEATAEGETAEPPIAKSQLQRREPKPEDELTEQQTKGYNLYLEIKVLFEQMLPVIMCVLVLGILTGSTAVFSLAMFFCYATSTILFNYLKTNSRIGKQYMREETRPYLELLSGMFMLAIFISYFVRTEFNT